MQEYFIQRDGREKENHGWMFDLEEKKPGRTRVLGTKEESLDAGDYSIFGHTELIRIERKMGIREVFGNYSPVSNKERFEREMEKLRPIKHKFILIESFLTQDLMSLTVPQFKYGLPFSRVYDWLIFLELEYDIHCQFVGDAGRRAARIIFENVAKRYL